MESGVKQRKETVMLHGQAIREISVVDFAGTDSKKVMDGE
jgi:hypothetical protein